MPRERTDSRAALWRLASGQQGYFTAAQARQAGFSYQTQRYHAQHGNWLIADRGIYRFREFETLPGCDNDQLVRWALWSRGRAVASHATALSVHDLGIANPSEIHLTVPPSFRQQNSTVIIHRAMLAAEEIEDREGFRVTTPVRAIAESAAIRMDEDAVASATAEGLDRGLFTRRHLIDAAQRLGAHAELAVERALREI